ncbi:hypothetical protein EYC84_007954 [Monilinia fructicola]|uniref:Sulfatase N-terminal domain-containing protein n=1 Tax=Monilinia fructicola TaxID=38448 RepID=A0A5M9JPS1_MONFR|nr:hypothetical protein EYC84_007954 [Monilinia fructicola]
MAPDLNTVPSSPRLEKKSTFPSVGSTFVKDAQSEISDSKHRILMLLRKMPWSSIQHIALRHCALLLECRWLRANYLAELVHTITPALSILLPQHTHIISEQPDMRLHWQARCNFIGEQLHGYESRLTSDIYPGDYGWAVNWEEPDKRLECNQLDYDEEVMYKSTQFLYDHVRKGPNTRPFCMTVSLTHPHDPYNIQKKFWDLYEGVDIDLPETKIPQEELDAHSKRLLKVCDLWGKDFTEDEQIKRARRAYYGADCRLDENTIIVFSGDHGDMLGERGLWYKMSYFEASVRVPLLVHYPKYFNAHHVSENVSTLDILPTLADLANVELWPGLPMDGSSLLPHLQSRPGGSDTVFAEYCGEGTISPMMMIRRGPWKYITCPADPDQLYNLAEDPKEVTNLASLPAKHPLMTEETTKFLNDFKAEAAAKWDFEKLPMMFYFLNVKDVLFGALLKLYIRSHIPLDDLELRARYPPVDSQGRDLAGVGMGGSGAGGMGSHRISGRWVYFSLHIAQHSVPDTKMSLHY